MEERFEWVDQLRFIGIMAVILGHISTPLSSFIYSWHMPLFFMISGFFMKPSSNKAVGEMIRKDFQRLMIPYFIFTFIGLIVEFAKRILLKRDSLDLGREIGSILYRMDYSSLQNHYGFVLWFLPALFFSRTFYTLITKIPYLSLVNGFPLIIGLFYLSFQFKLHFELDVAMNSLFWVMLGSLLFKGFQKKMGLPVLLIILIIALFFYGYLGIPQLNLSEKLYSNPLHNILWVILLVAGLVSILKTMNIEKAPKFSKETMFLMVFHPYSNNVAHLVVERFFSGAWPVKFILSLSMLQGMLMIRRKIGNVGIFKYV